MKDRGVLYGVGVGPGDPELLTLRAARVLGRVEEVFAASSSKNDYSLALSIAEKHVRPGAAIRNLAFPMTRDPEGLARAWEANAKAVLDALHTGRDAAFLTLGDPMLFSTFVYLLRAVRALEPEVRVEVVPGVTSFQQAAAVSGTPLAESGESLLVLSGVNETRDLARRMQGADNAVILKAYRNFPAIRDWLASEDLDREAVFASRLGLEGETVVRGLADLPDDPHYLSLLLIKKGRA
ncbi:MAG: precorrin-2 C(20)-methyltransferase [Deltaproteobacteria bacterium]|nr:precorrin-2 C(20)-methyltransferase [Deltaproteobacteria bacterium]